MCSAQLIGGIYAPYIRGSMPYSVIREVIGELDRLIAREDIPEDAKVRILHVKKSLYTVLDELVWTRSKVFEALRDVEELAKALGVARAKKSGVYVEASLVYDREGAKVRVERTL